MAEPVVTVGKYTDAMAANMAHAQLQAEGIRATLTGDLPSMFPGNVTLTQYQLQVAESDRERALQVLFDGEHEELDPNWEANIEKEGGWVCSLCGSVLQDDQEMCPDCLTERGAVTTESPVRQRGAFHATPGEKSDGLQKEEPTPIARSRVNEPAPPDTEIDLPDEDELRADSALARLTMGAAIGGIFLMPLTVYSIYLLFKVAKLEGKLTAQRRKTSVVGRGTQHLRRWFLPLHLPCPFLSFGQGIVTSINTPGRRHKTSRRTRGSSTRRRLAIYHAPVESTAGARPRGRRES